ncbi:MAG TPA: hypothetical protein VI338_02035 [Nitrososphaera sp.]|nr:hypothetical protein [Nitrososphaera sp.]
MIPNLGSTLDKVQSLLGKGYLLGGFVPMLFFMSISGFVLHLSFNPARYAINRLLEQAALEQSPFWVGLICACGIAGFFLWSLNPFLRNILEGWFLPEPIRRSLEKRQQDHLRKIESEIKSLHDELFLYRRATLGKEPWGDCLAKARNLGTTKGSKKSITLSTQVAQALNEARKMRNSRESIQFKEVESLVNLLEKELGEKSANTLDSLDRADQECREIIAYAMGAVENEYANLVSRKKFAYPTETDLGPTSLANAAILHRDYAFSRYGMDIEVFWPSMQKIIRKDEKFNPILEESKLRLDISVSITVMFLLLTVVWSLFLVMVSKNLWMNLVISLGGTLITAGSYQVAVQNFRAFSEAVRSGIDLYRFDLLKEMRIKSPSNSSEEKKLWQQLTSHAVLEPSGEVSYDHTS